MKRYLIAAGLLVAAAVIALIVIFWMRSSNQHASPATSAASSTDSNLPAPSAALAQLASSAAQLPPTDTIIASGARSDGSATVVVPSQLIEGINANTTASTRNVSVTSATGASSSSPSSSIAAPIITAPNPCPYDGVSSYGGRYCFYSKKDSWGGDVDTMSASNLDALQQTCDEYEGACLAFNTNGSLKATLAPHDQWRTYMTQDQQGLYVRKEALNRI